MTSKLEQLIEDGKATETDRICEHELARVTGQPSLSSLLNHMSRHDQGDLRDIVACGLHLPVEEYDILVEAAERIKSAQKKARYT